MIGTPKELLQTWYDSWKRDLDACLAQQAQLTADYNTNLAVLQDTQARIQAVMSKCEEAFTTLFPTT